MSFKEPKAFASKLESGDHTLLLYEDKMKAHEIRLNFIKDGLEENQSCVYITSESDGNAFEKSLKEKNLDMKKIKKNGLFHVFNISQPFTNFGGFSKSVDAIKKEISKTVKSPMRIAYNIVGDISKISDKQIDELLEKESVIQQNMDDSKDMHLCTYFVGNVDSETDSKFLESIKLHHSVMFAPVNSEGIGFNLD